MAATATELEWVAELMARRRVQVDDPILAAVIDKTALRARVEVAKHGCCA